MATNYTPIATGAAANAAGLNAVFDEFDLVIGDPASLDTAEQSVIVDALNELLARAVTWGANASDNLLKSWVEGGDYELTAITYDGTYTGTVASATVKWPDGSAGAFTTTSINATFESIDAYTITHTATGKTITQAAVTRNADGNITAKPALTVS